jgi:hypothetical protein
VLTPHVWTLNTVAVRPDVAAAIAEDLATYLGTHALLHAQIKARPQQQISGGGSARETGLGVPGPAP